MQCHVKAGAMACLFMLMAAISGCSGDNPVESDRLPTKRIEATITLPDGVELPSPIEALSAFDAATVQGNRFSLTVADTSGNDVLLIVDGKENVLMIGYPMENGAYEVSARSTALALVMMCSWSVDLDEEGRRDVITHLIASPSFADLEAAVADLLRENLPLFSEKNQVLADRMGDVLRNDLRLSSADDPVLVLPLDNEIVLQNNYRSHSYAAGIYRDGQMQKVIDLPGVQLVNASWGDFLDGNFKNLNEPDEVRYSPQGDGRYEVRVTSGMEQLDSPESKRAFSMNMLTAVESALAFTGLPEMETKCGDAVVGIIRTNVETAVTMKPPRDQAEMYRTAANAIIANKIAILEVLEECPSDIGKNFRRFFKAVSGFLDLSSKAAAAWNGGKFLHDLFADRKSMQHCFDVVGGSIAPCIDGDWLIDFTFVHNTGNPADPPKPWFSWDLVMARNGTSVTGTMSNTVGQGTMQGTLTGRKFVGTMQLGWDKNPWQSMTFEFDSRFTTATGEARTPIFDDGSQHWYTIQLKRKE